MMKMQRAGRQAAFLVSLAMLFPLAATASINLLDALDAGTSERLSAWACTSTTITSDNDVPGKPGRRDLPAASSAAHLAFTEAGSDVVRFRSRSCETVVNPYDRVTEEVTCNVFSSRQSDDICLLLATTASVEVYCNGMVVSQLNLGTRIPDGYCLYRMTMSCGSNQLRLKLHTVGSLPSFQSTIFGSRRALVENSFCYGSCFLLASVYAKGANDLEYYVPGVQEADSIETEITDTKGRLVAKADRGNGSGNSILTGLTDGLYFVTFKCFGLVRTEAITLGSLQASYLSTREQIRRNADGGGLAARLEGLMSPKYFRPNEPSWQRAFVKAIEQAATIESGTVAHDGTPFLLTATSRVDSSRHSYLGYVPRHAIESGSRVPVLVVAPTLRSSNDTFLLSPFANSVIELDRLCLLADKYQFAIVWPGYRTNEHLAELEFAHCLDVVTDFEERFKKNLTPGDEVLIGVCSGAGFAVILAETFPGRFHQFGFLNPTIRVYPTASELMADAGVVSLAYRAHIEKIDPYPALLKSNKDVFIRRELNSPHPGDVEGTEALVSLNRGILFERTAATQSQGSAIVDVFIAARKKGRQFSSLAELSFDAQSRRSVSSALARGFALWLSPTTDEESNGEPGIKHAVRTIWTDCSHGNISLIDRLNYNSGGNLLIIGLTSDLEVSKLLKKNKIVVREDVIEIEGANSIVGKNLSLVTLLTNPSAPDRSIVLVTAAKSTAITPDILNLALDGWYRTAVRDCMDGVVVWKYAN
jgi:hypothetical protein